MVLKVYTFPLAAPGRNVFAALFEKDVEFEFVLVDVRKGEQKSPEHLKRSPFGKIPVLEDDGITLFDFSLESRLFVVISLLDAESRAILRYIASNYEEQGTSLYGRTPEEKALVEQWTEAEGQNWSPVVSALNSELFVKKFLHGQDQDPAVVEAQEKKFNVVLDVYEDRLSKSKYLAGDFFSMADLVHLGSTYSLTTVSGRADLIASRPHVAAWWENISARPSWQKVISYTTSLLNKI